MQSTSDTQRQVPKLHDIIEIIPSHYVPDLPIGNRYVVLKCEDGWDVEVVNEKGEFCFVCAEDFKIIGTVNDLRMQKHKKLKDDQEKSKIL